MLNRICSIDGCGGEHKGHGFCKPHYDAFRYHGDPLARKRRVRGTGTITEFGYLVHCKNGEDKLEHVAIAEKALGRVLRDGEEVHHGNGIKLDNRNDNLVICQSRAYHRLLHMRMDALAACGHADWRKCKRCHQYDDPTSMMKDGSSMVHRACNVEHVRAAKAKLKTSGVHWQMTARAFPC